MGKAKRFNTYDETVKAQREKTKGFGQERQNLAGIGSSFRSPPLQPPIATKLKGTGTGDGKFLTVSLSADQTANIAVNNHVEFDTKDEDGGIVLQTGAGQADGIFELLGGRKYYLQASLRPEFSGSTGQLEVAWFDQTNSAEIGSRAKYEAQDHSGSDANQPTAAALVTPTTNILVKLEILSVTALDALANEYCHANLFEIALGGFTSGGGGGGGGAITFPITPTIKDESDTWTSPVTIDLALTTAHITKFTLDTDLTLVFSNPPSSGTQIEFEIEFLQDATGGRTVTFPASVQEVVSIASGPSSQTIVTCRTNDGGTKFNVIPALRGSISLSGNFANIELDNLANVAINTSLISDTDDTDDLGSASKEWKDLFIDGTANIDTLAATTMSGILAMGDNDITGTADIIPNTQGTKNLGDAATEWNKLFIEEIVFTDTQALSDVTIPTIGWDTALAPDAMFLNVPSGQDIIFKFAGAIGFTFNAAGVIATGTSGFTGLQFFCNDAATDPTMNGEIQRNTNDVKVFSGGAVRNFTDIASGATIELDNLGTTAINADLDPATAGVRDLGNAGAEWDNLFIESILFTNTQALADITVPTIGYDTALAPNAMLLNVPSGEDIILEFAGVTGFTFNAAGLVVVGTSGVISEEFFVNSAGADPTLNGEIVRNVNDVKVFSGGAVRNFTNMVETNVSNTWTADQISDGLTNLGTTANPWNNIVSDNTLFCSNFKVFDTDSDINVFNDLDMQAGDTVDFNDNSASAAAGTNGDVPSQVVGYIQIKVQGVVRKVPFYAT